MKGRCEGHEKENDPVGREKREKGDIEKIRLKERVIEMESERCRWGCNGDVTM